MLRAIEILAKHNCFTWFYNNQTWKRWITMSMLGGGGNKYLTAGNTGEGTDCEILSGKKVVRKTIREEVSIIVFAFKTRFLSKF